MFIMISSKAITGEASDVINTAGIFSNSTVMLTEIALIDITTMSSVSLITIVTVTTKSIRIFFERKINTGSLGCAVIIVIFALIDIDTGAVIFELREIPFVSRITDTIVSAVIIRTDSLV
jgi:hypothetical protein